MLDSLLNALGIAIASNPALVPILLLQLRLWWVTERIDERVRRIEAVQRGDEEIAVLTTRRKKAKVT